jgi:cytochrome c5
MRRFTLLCCFLVFAACDNRSATTDPGGPVNTTAPAESSNGIVSGEAAYEQYCIGCHETGLLDAPVVGDAREWEEVSKLWQAVVVEHAKDGYFDMPAKGGRPELSDEVVQAAVEHMLAITYPELPVDIR